MKKLLLVAVCLFAAFSTASAQDFVKGSKVLNVGIGLGNTLYSGSGYSTTIPPLSASLEFCVKDNLFDDKSSIGVGGFFGYASSSYKPFDGYKATYSDIILGARGALHYQFIDKLDTYAGLGLSYDIVSHSTTGSGYNGSFSSSGMYFSGFLGARYYFSENIGAMAELGYNVSVLSVGLAIKF